ncbi:MAG: DinB family protein [Bacillota bacterium]
MGHLPEEPGCIWLAQTPEEVMARAPAAISGYDAWLRRHGEAPGVRRGPDSISVELAEQRVAENFGQSGGAVGLFTPDLMPATATFIAAAVRRLGYARRDLLELVEPLPADLLDWTPPGGKRTIRANLHHLRNAQGWYLTRLFGWEGTKQLLPEPWPQETFESLQWTLERCCTALLELPEPFRSGTYQAQQPMEDWTARKMLRRFVEHEREHIEVVRLTIAAWQSGGPVARPWEVTAPTVAG